MVRQRHRAVRGEQSAALGAGDRHPVERAACKSAWARARARLRAAIYVPAGMPDCLARFSVAMGTARQSGFSRTEELAVRADARRVTLARGVPQARALRW